MVNIAHINLVNFLAVRFSVFWSNKFDMVYECIMQTWKILPFVIIIYSFHRYIIKIYIKYCENTVILVNFKTYAEDSDFDFWWTILNSECITKNALVLRGLHVICFSSKTFLTGKTFTTRKFIRFLWLIFVENSKTSYRAHGTLTVQIMFFWNYNDSLN